MAVFGRGRSWGEGRVMAGWGDRGGWGGGAWRERQAVGTVLVVVVVVGRH